MGMSEILSAYAEKAVRDVLTFFVMGAIIFITIIWRSQLKVKFWSRTLCALLFLITLLSAASVMNFAASEHEYASPSAPLSTSVYADDFLSDYVGVENILQVEADFLRLQSGFLLSYNSALDRLG